MDEPLFSCDKDFFIYEVTGVTSVFPLLPETLKKIQIFFRNTYKIHHYKTKNRGVIRPLTQNFELVILLSSRQLLQRKGWFIRMDMRAQPHCIAKTYVVYWKDVDLLAFMMLQSSCCLSPRPTATKCR